MSLLDSSLVEQSLSYADQFACGEKDTKCAPAQPPSCTPSILRELAAPSHSAALSWPCLKPLTP